MVVLILGSTCKHSIIRIDQFIANTIGELKVDDRKAQIVVQ
jgi:hypothetical protein